MSEKRGYTLIELIVTIAIISILTILIVFLINKYLEGSKTRASVLTEGFLNTAVTLYVSEFKVNDEWHTDVDENNIKTGGEFTCTSIQEVINKGFLPKNLVDPKTKKKIDTSTLIKIIRNMTTKVLETILDSDDESCTTFDNVKPSLSIKINGEKINNWYKSVKATIIPTYGDSGLKSKQIYIKYNNKILYDNLSKVNEDTYNVSLNGKGIRICGKITNGFDVTSGEVCSEAINIDNTTPNKPEITASDGIKSGELHQFSNFTLNFNSSGVSTSNSNCGSIFGVESAFCNPNNPLYIGYISSNNDLSKIKYYFGYTNDNLSLTADKLLIDSGDNKKNIYVKACNELDVCSDISNYFISIYIAIPDIYPNFTVTPTCNATCQMQANAESWWDLQIMINSSNGSPEEQAAALAKQEELHKVNESLSIGNPDCKGKCTYVPSSGIWYDENGNRLFNVSTDTSIGSNTVGSTGTTSPDIDISCEAFWGPGSVFCDPDSIFNEVDTGSSGSTGGSTGGILDNWGDTVFCNPSSFLYTGVGC